MLTDTCPACNAVVEFEPDGQWHWCPACHQGRLRWVPDDLAGQLEAELAEVDGWVREGVKGATELAMELRERLRRETNERG